MPYTKICLRLRHGKHFYTSRWGSRACIYSLIWCLYENIQNYRLALIDIYACELYLILFKLELK